MTIGAIDLLARRREMVGGNTRERLSPERAVLKLLTLRSRWIEAVTFDGRFSAIEKVIGSGCVSRYLNRDPNNERFGMFWMSHGRIGLELSAGDRTVRRTMQKLRTLGYTELIEPGGGRYNTKSP
jgi:hypothetical protein